MLLQDLVIDNEIDGLQLLDLFADFFIFLWELQIQLYWMEEYPVFLKLVRDFLDFCECLQHDFSFSSVQVEFNEAKPEE